ncbi:MAG: S41 family peptidase [Pyrinomonadaceae bacterium]
MHSQHRRLIHKAWWLGFTLFLFSVMLPGPWIDKASAQQAPASSSTPQPPAAPAIVSAPEVSDTQKRQEAFEIVWSTVKQVFYDPSFGGLDWEAVRSRYQPLVKQARNDVEVHQLLQKMLNELGQSHFLIIPPEAIPQFRAEEGDDEGEDATAADKTEKTDPAKLLLKGNLELTQKLTTGIGIDLRIINGLAVVTRVEPGSTAAAAGLRPGFVIKKADGLSLERIIGETLRSPLYHAIIRPELPLILVAGYINGPPQTSVRLSYLDGRNRIHTATIKRERLKGEMSSPVGVLPAMYGEIESRRLASGIGYIRFNAFVPSLMEKLCRAIRSLSDAPGLVIDLRGNQGGLLGMLGGLSGLLQQYPLPLGFMETRGGQTPLYAFPQKLPYTGTLVILIDGSTESAAEMFAGGMQEAGRAVVVGETSAGNTLPSVVKQLPTGALFQFAFANYRTSLGALLEGHGVKPDVAVRLTRQALLSGHDAQLDAAIRRAEPKRVLGRRTRVERGRTELIADVTVTELKPATDGPTKVVVGDPAPPPKPLPETVSAAHPGPSVIAAKPMTEDDTAKTAVANAPTPQQIIEKYVEAAGGKAAFAKLHSRVSRAQTETVGTGQKGSLELYEKAPNKFAMLIDVPGVGIMMRGNNDQASWWQDPLQGYIEFSGPGWFDAIREAYFDKTTRLKDLYPNWEFKGKEKVGQNDAYVLQGTTSNLSKYYFDVHTGLLLRKGNTYYEDYREIDGVKLPYLIREDSLLGFTFVYKITDIKHNVPIDDAKFAPYPSCFTNPGR